MTERDKRLDAFLNVGIWLLFFALLVPAGVVGWAIGRHDGTKKTTEAAAAAPSAARPPCVAAERLLNDGRQTTVFAFRLGEYGLTLRLARPAERRSGSPATKTA